MYGLPFTTGNALVPGPPPLHHQQCPGSCLALLPGPCSLSFPPPSLVSRTKTPTSIPCPTTAKSKPWIYFHPDEEYFPSLVSWFFKNGVTTVHCSTGKATQIPTLSSPPLPPAAAPTPAATSYLHRIRSPPLAHLMPHPTPSIPAPSPSPSAPTDVSMWSALFPLPAN